MDSVMMVTCQLLVTTGLYSWRTSLSRPSDSRADYQQTHLYSTDSSYCHTLNHQPDCSCNW